MSYRTLQTIVNLLQWAAPLLLAATVVTLGILLFRFRSPNRKKHILRFSIALCAMCACGLGLSWAVPKAYVAGREEERANQYAESSSVHVGDSVPPFVVTDTTGSEFSTEALRGKVLLINFFATWCGPCKMELPHLEELNAEFRNYADFESIIIGRGETIEVVRQYQSLNAIQVRMAADSDEIVFSKFASDTIPRTIVVSADGKIVYSKAGFYDRDVETIRRTISTNL